MYTTERALKHIEIWHCYTVPAAPLTRCLETAIVSVQTWVSYARVSGILKLCLSAFRESKMRILPFLAAPLIRTAQSLKRFKNRKLWCCFIKMPFWRETNETGLESPFQLLALEAMKQHGRW